MNEKQLTAFLDYYKWATGVSAGLLALTAGFLTFAAKEMLVAWPLVICAVAFGWAVFAGVLVVKNFLVYVVLSHNDPEQPGVHLRFPALFQGSEFRTRAYGLTQHWALVVGVVSLFVYVASNLVSFRTSPARQVLSWGEWLPSVAWTSTNGFFEAFWPNLASTVLGIFLGVPLALWVNKRMVSYGERLKAGERQQILNTALEMLGSALVANRDRLDILVESLGGNRARFDTELDLATWEAVKPVIADQLRDPLLHGRLAYHFSRLASITKLNDMYLNYAAGIAAALGGSDRTRDALQVYLLVSATQQRVEAEELQTLVSNSQEQGVSRKSRGLKSAIAWLMRKVKLFKP